MFSIVIHSLNVSCTLFVVSLPSARHSHSIFLSLCNVLIHTLLTISLHTVYPKKYAQGFCFAVLCCGYTLTDFPIYSSLTLLALWQSNDYPSASKATLMNMDKYFMWIHYERLHNHNKAKHNKTVCIFLGIYCNSALSLSNTCCGETIPPPPPPPPHTHTHTHTHNTTQHTHTHTPSPPPQPSVTIFNSCYD